MKRGIIFLAAVLFVLGWAVSTFAVTADTTHKGSLLIYPKIDVSEYQRGFTDTYIFLSNDGPSAVDVKCYWVRGDNQDFTDFQFSLSKYQEYDFSATFGGFNYTVQVPPWPFEAYRKGFLACFAVANNGATAANWNYLYGNAWVVDFCNNTAYSYPAWSFRVVSGATGSAPTALTLPVPAPIGGSTDAGLSLPLDGVTYTSCPAQLAFNFPLEGGMLGSPFKGVNDLTLLPCKQDLRQDHNITKTKLQFDIWNTFETKFTNAWACSNCWWDLFLNDSSIHYAAAFSTSQEAAGFSDCVSHAGRFRVTAVQSSQCPGSTPAGLIGLLVSYIPTYSDEVNTDSIFNYSAFAFSSNGFAPSADGPAGFIYFDPAGADMPGVKKAAKK
jgi:hypothetical protein